MRLTAIGVVALAIGCGTARIHVVPDAASVNSASQAQPACVALRIDDKMALYSTTATTHPSALQPAGSGYTTIEVTYDMGAALAHTIENTVRRHFRETRRTDSQNCPPGTEAFIDVKFAKPPEISVRWVTEMTREGGGAAVELTADVAVQRCDGRTVWHSVIQGYGSEQRAEGGFL
ncbi:MAG: hypothetical protein ACHQ9S_09590 [Candidatus Binatia bacterium]